MTNSSLRYALDAIAAAALLASAGCGCGGVDPEKEMSAGNAAFEVRDFAKAQAHFANAAEVAPGNVDALVMLARSRLALGDLPSASDALSKASAIAGGEADVLQLSAQIAYYSKDYEGAAKNFRRLAEDPAMPKEVRSAAWAGLGVVDFFLSDSQKSVAERDVKCAKARTEFLRALRLDSKNAAAYYHLGRLYRDTFDMPDSAEEQFRMFVNPHVSPVPDGRVRKVQDEYLPQLKETLRERAARIPGARSRDKRACAEKLKRGDAAAEAGKLTEASMRYAEAAKADPLDALAARKLARTLGRIAKDEAGRKAARRAYLKACELAGADRAFTCEAAAFMMKCEAYPLAEGLYSKAFAAGGPAARDMTALDGLIRALGKTGRPGASGVAAVYQSYRDAVSRK